jgi:folate/biopterin transporter
MVFSSLGLNRTRWTPELVAILGVYFVQGALGLARLATSFYFKDDLGLSPAQVAALMGIATAPWTVKPLYGWISDSLPIANYRRRPYMILAGMVGCLSWLAMGTVVNSAWSATVALVLSSLSFAIADVIVDALVVERTQQEDREGAGTLQSLSWGATALGSLLTAYWGGALLERLSPQTIFQLAALLPLCVAIAAIVIDEQPVSSLEKPAGGWSQVKQLWRTVRRPALFLPIGFIFLWQATPSADTAFFYFVTNDLHFGPEFLGRVRLATSIASLIGIVIFQRWLRTVPLRRILLGITLISFVLGLTSLILVTHTNRSWGIDDRWFSLGDSVILTVAGQIAFMPILVLAARICPAGIEATLFALLMSALNLAGIVSQELGAILMHWLGVTETDFTAMPTLVLIANATTLLPLPFLGWLPDDAAVTTQSEAEYVEDVLVDLQTAATPQARTETASSAAVTSAGIVPELD